MLCVLSDLVKYSEDEVLVVIVRIGSVQNFDEDLLYEHADLSSKMLSSMNEQCIEDRDREGEYGLLV